MKLMARLIVLILFSSYSSHSTWLLLKHNRLKRRLPSRKFQKANLGAWPDPMPRCDLSKSRLVDDFIRRYNATTGSNLIP